MKTDKISETMLKDLDSPGIESVVKEMSHVATARPRDSAQA